MTGHKPKLLIFAGDTHYPRGGWSDFVGVADTLAEAHRQLASARDSQFSVLHHDWWQIVSADTLKVVDESD